jgi:glycosyltransferase involved in cell wall biosynthesis
LKEFLPKGFFMRKETKSKGLIIHVATIARSFFYFKLDRQIRYMTDNGFKVTVAAYPDESLERFALQSGSIALGIRIKKVISPVRDVLTIFNTWRKFRLLKPQIVHAHTPKGGLVGMISAFLAGIEVRFYHVHGLPHMTSSGIKRKLLILSEKLSCSLAHRVYFVSLSIKEIAIKEGLCPHRKAKVLCSGSINGVDALGQYNPRNYDCIEIRNRLKIPQRSHVIGFIGRLVVDKGAKELIESWLFLREKYTDLILLIVGPMEERDAIPHDIKRKIMEDDRIVYIGEVDDTAPYYSAMDILAFPSYREGFGVVAIEASAMQVPVVATTIPGCVESVVDNETGLLVQPRDSSALTNALESYLSNPVLRAKHGLNGRQRVLRQFQQESIWEAQYLEYIDCLEQIKKSNTQPNKSK